MCTPQTGHWQNRLSPAIALGRGRLTVSGAQHLHCPR